jgi:hypothetical protein
MGKCGFVVLRDRGVAAQVEMFIGLSRRRYIQEVRQGPFVRAYKPVYLPSQMGQQVIPVKDIRHLQNFTITSLVPI